MAQHARWRHAGASNNASLVVHCDGPLDPARLRAALHRLLAICPWPAARLERPLPWGKLRWTTGTAQSTAPVTVNHRSVRTSAELHALVEAELATVIDPWREPPMRLTVIDVGDGGVLVLTWFHPLMDPRGAQTLLVHLATLDGAEADVDPSTFVAAPARAPLRERGRLARRSLEYMRTLAPVAPVSPGSQLTTAGRPRFLRESFVERDPDARSARLTREISWRLAVVGKAMAELWRRRGLPDVPFLLPIAVDLRPKGEAGPVFGNLLAFHFARFRLSDTEDVATLASTLRRQMADAVRDGQIEANVAAMEFLQYRPLSRMLGALPWTAQGDIFSFNCADVSDMPPALDRFFGRRLLNGYHVPCVLPRPGVGVFFNRCADLNNVVVSWIAGALSEPEAARILEVVGEEMEWIAKP